MEYIDKKTGKIGKTIYEPKSFFPIHKSLRRQQIKVISTKEWLEHIKYRNTI
jgi:hypothetical protein